MRLSRILLASAAVLSFSSFAVAADAIMGDYEEEAPVALGTPVSDVGVCEVVGYGYFNIPGSGTCLKIGGAVEANYGYLNHKQKGSGNTLKQSGSAYGIQARIDFDTHSDTEFGALASKLRAGVRYDYSDYLFQSNNDDFGLELAYIKYGPAYVGYKETLANLQYGYGELFNMETYLGSSNSLTAGIMFDELGGGYYVGVGVEDARRGQFMSSAAFEKRLTPDLVGRVGIANQPWGSTDLSVVYSKEAEHFSIKSTTDYNVIDGVQLRMTGAYFDAEGDRAYLISGGVKYDFAENISGYAGLGYGDVKKGANGYLANAGLVFTPAEGFDITGELGYARVKDNAPGVKNDAYSGILKFVRSW